MLFKTTIREIKGSITRYLAIFAIIGLGVCVFTGLKMCKPAMVDTANDYLQEHNMYDYQILSSYGVDDDSVKMAMETEGVVQAEGSIEKDVLIKNSDNNDAKESVYKAIMIPEKINTINIVEGRMPNKDNECVVDNYISADSSSHYEIGQTIIISDNNTNNDLDTFKYKKYKVVGKANTPLYLDYDRGTTSLGNGTVDSFFYINKDAFDVDYYTQMYIKLKGNEYSFSEELGDKLKKYQKPMENLAEKVTTARRSVMQEEGQKMLDEKRAEYNAGLAKYNYEKALAEGKITSSKKELVNGRALIGKNEAELRLTLKDVKSKKKQLEDAIQRIDSKISEIKAAHDRGELSDAEYLIELGVVEATKSSLNSNMTAVNDGIAQINDALTQINDNKKKIKDGEKTLQSKEKTAKSEFAKARAELKKAEAALADAEDQIDEMETGNNYAFSREDNTGYNTFESNVDIVSNIAKIFPVFFFLVAALVVMTTMTRMVDEQRSQIGVFRALGYKNRSIRNKYLFYSGSASFIGAILGFVLGSKLYPAVIWKAYTMMYDFNPKVNFLLDWKLGIATIAVSLVCAMGSTWLSCSNEFREVPAELIRPKAPPTGKKILLEKITGIWNRMSFMRKVSFRNVFRYKKRLFMMILGICGCTAMLVAAFGVKSSIGDVAEHQFTEFNKYDYQISFTQDMNSDDQKEFKTNIQKSVGDYGEITFLHSGNVEAKLKSGNRSLMLFVVDEKDAFKVVNLEYNGKAIKYPGDGEVAICRKLQDQLGVKIGDTLKFKEGYREMSAKVSAVYDNYISESIYMSNETYKRGMEKAASIKTAYVNAPKGLDIDTIREQSTKVSQEDCVAVSMVSADIRETVESMMKSMNAIVYAIILAAATLAFIVLYNLTNINIIERIREIATIKVLGFYSSETSQYVFRENIIMTFIAAVVGLPAGKLLLDFIINSINIEMMFFVAKITPLDYVIAFAATFIFTFIVNIALKPKLNKISMAESLKSVE